jgi:hypothetical protein
MGTGKEGEGEQLKKERGVLSMAAMNAQERGSSIEVEPLVVCAGAPDRVPISGTSGGTGAHRAHLLCFWGPHAA